MTPYDSEFKRAEEAPDYRNDLIADLRELNQGWRFFLDEKAKLHYDEELFSECITLMVVIIAQLLPKLEGGGAKTEKLFTLMKPYEKWLDDVMIPKLREREKVGELYKLIIRGYDLLGLTQI